MSTATVTNPTAADPVQAWDYLQELEATLSDSDRSIPAFREALESGDRSLKARFGRSEPIERLVQDRAQLADTLVRKAWRLHARGKGDELALVAVGGYGRGELHPCSDIDVMILLPAADGARWQAILESFLTFLWDIGLEIGHSVRTVEDCRKEAAQDVTVATTLMEARLLAGPAELFAAMREATRPEHVWNSRDFFEAKLKEQQARHRRYHDTAYNLEPNVKGSPGGLRDIQMIGWVAKRHFGAETLDDLVSHQFLTEGQLKRLLDSRAFLWKIRFALHTLTGRREDRLLFDYQIKLAEMLGYEDASYTLAVEQMMQRYYRTVMDLSRLNEMLLQLFQEAILMDPNVAPEPINERFRVKNGFLQVVHEHVFTQYPSALLETFLLLQQNPQLRGVSASTITLIRRNVRLIDEEFRQNPRNHRLFLDIIRAPQGVTHELRRMNLYGVLGHYIPAFGRIVGRMQYDLFHAYTVDAHTLFVVSNLRRFTLPRFNEEFPYCSRIMQGLPKTEIAYLAGLFHDIAKGRGGDHSILGAVDAEAFCLEQGMSRYDARLVAWLVRHHLILSVTAQKKDISDPKVIHDFAVQVGDQVHLDYLYVLTVADVRGTNPNLWNSWKAALFEEFYERTKGALRRGLENPIDKEELFEEIQAEARKLLARDDFDKDAVDATWKTLTDEYFLRHTPEEIAWHTALLNKRQCGEAPPLISIREKSDRGGTAIALYTSQSEHTFAKATAVLDQLGLSIVDARIMPTMDGYSLDTYSVLEDNGSAITERGRLQEIQGGIVQALTNPDANATIVTRRAPRQVRMFSTTTQIDFSQDAPHSRTVMELVTGDRPGLLSELGKCFMTEDIYLHNAKITTAGERAEDVFYISNREGKPLDESSRERLRHRLTEVLKRKQ